MIKTLYLLTLNALLSPLETIKKFRLSKLFVLFRALVREDSHTIINNFRKYLSINPEKTIAQIDPFQEVSLEKQTNISRPIEEVYPFDVEFYTEQLRSLDKYDASVQYDYRHYIEHGYKLKISPNPFFDHEYYSMQTQLPSNAIAFEHFLTNENANISPHPLIDYDYISNRRVILKSDGNNIIEKLISYYDEFHPHLESPSYLFAAQWYRIQNENTSDNPLAHFLTNKYRNGHPLSYPKIYYEHVCNGNYLRNIAFDLLTTEQRNIISYDKSVSIIILNWNKSILTLQCVSTLLRNTTHDNFEIIIVDNGSNSEDYYILDYYLSGFCKIIRNEHNRFFGEANNIASEIAQGEFLVFLNNDAFPKQGWLEPLINTYQKEKNSGGVGSILLFPDGSLQETGGKISTNGIITQENKGQNIDNLENLVSNKTDYKSAAAFLMEKSIFTKIGGFDYIYEPAYFEDTDLCMKLKMIGRQVYSCPESFVVHVENLTSKTENIGFEFNANVRINRKKFALRWDPFLESNGQKKLVSRNFDLDNYYQSDNGSSLKQAYVYTPYNLVPGGGERYILSVAIGLVKLKYKVTLLTECRYSKIRLRNIATDLNLDITLIEEIDLLPKYELSLKKENIQDLFVVMGNTALPEIEPIGLDNIYHCQFPFPIHDASFILRSRKNITGYDKVIVNSHFTAEHMFKSLQHYKVKIPDIKVLFPPVFHYQSTQNFKENIILSVGRFSAGGHNKNHKFLIEAFKEFIGSKPEYELHLVGSTYFGEEHQNYVDSLIQIAKDYPIQFHFDASDIELETLYRKSKVYWHATGFGSEEKFTPELMEHFGITVVESMLSGGIPIVYDGGGPKEILMGFPELRYLSRDELIAKTISVIDNSSNSDLYHRLEKRGKRYTESKFFTTLENIVNERSTKNLFYTSS